MGRNNRAKRERAAQTTNGRGTFTDEPMNVDNPAFSKFYGSGIIPSAEWNQCLECFRTALPTSFRFNTSLPNAVALRDHVTSYLRELGQQLTPLAFVPNSMAFQTASSRGEIKRNAANKAVKQLMHVLNEEGYLSRQEAVSMIPPLLLDVQPGHRVIDMCAAPGSKTTQILESLVRQGPGGVVVANDVNQGRLDVLNHQTARLPDAKSRLIVTNHDATAFPLVTSAEHKFDRVLCDVMCSGDGTLRKSMDLWARWNPLLGPHLHIQQSRVLLRGMGLCKVGGIVVYSTCSMNPAEDEAVIARCLEEVGGAFELIDPHPILSQLKYYKGLHEWRLMNADASVELHQYSDSRPTTVNRDANQTSSNAEAAVEVNHPDASRQQAKGKSRFTFTPSMFPPPAARAAEMKLERCVRVAPHLQDTGGFFIAALRCVSELPKSVSSTGVGKYGDSPIRPLPAELAKEVATRMKLSDAFPMHRLFTASTEDSRNPKVYYLSEDCANMMSTMNAKLIQAGVKVFESNVKRSWAHLRIASDGAATLARVFPECVTRCNAEAVLKHFMSHSDGEVVRWPVDDFKSTIAVEPAAFDVSRGHGIAELHCGTWLGCVYLPMEVSHGTVYIRASRTQLSLLKLGHGVPLVAPGEDAADSDSDSNSGDGLEESAPARPQPAVE